MILEHGNKLRVHVPKTSFSANLSHLILGLTFHIIQRRTNFVKKIHDGSGTLPQN